MGDIKKIIVESRNSDYKKVVEEGRLEINKLENNQDIDTIGNYRIKVFDKEENRILNLIENMTMEDLILQMIRKGEKAIGYPDSFKVDDYHVFSNYIIKEVTKKVE